MNNKDVKTSNVRFIHYLYTDYSEDVVEISQALIHYRKQNGGFENFYLEYKSRPTPTRNIIAQKFINKMHMMSALGIVLLLLLF